MAVLTGVASAEEAVNDSAGTLRWRAESGTDAAKLLRARGGCLGARSKGVAGCDKPGGAAKQALIPGFPN